MQRVKATDGGLALTSGETSKIITIRRTGDFGVEFTGTFGGETFDMQVSPNNSEAMADYYPDGFQEKITAPGVYTYKGISGQRYQFVGDGGGSGTSVKLFAGGDHVDVAS